MAYRIWWSFPVVLLVGWTNEANTLNDDLTAENLSNSSQPDLAPSQLKEDDDKKIMLLNETYTLPAISNEQSNIHSSRNFYFPIDRVISGSFIFDISISLSPSSCERNPKSIVRSLVTSANGIRTSITTTCLRKLLMKHDHHGSEEEEEELEEGVKETPRNPSASAVICPVSDKPDKIWIDTVGTPSTQFTFKISANDNRVKLDQPQKITITDFGRDPDFEDPSSFSMIVTFYLRHHTTTQIFLKFTSDKDDDIPAEFTLMKECHDGTAGVTREVRKIRGVRYATRMRMTARRAGTMILSTATHPRISKGKWHLGINLLDPKTALPGSNSSNLTGDSTQPRRRKILLQKTIMIHITDESDAFKIWPMFAWGLLSGLGLLAPIFYYKLLTQVEIKFGVKLGRAWVSVLLNWLLRGHKTYSYTTALFGVTLAVGAFQMVQENWYKMLVVGDRDLCFYNERCYITNLIYDYPFNLISSNMCYVIHGIIVGLSLSIREAYCFSEGHALYYDYSLGYALSWALFFEGVFSSIYHICPSRLIFQFDTNFMYLIGALTIACVFHGNSITQQTLLLLQRYSHLTEDVKKALNLLASQKSLHHTKIFLFFVAPILTFNYLGSIKEVSGFGPFVQVVFGLMVISWAVLILVWSGCKLDIFPDCVGLWKPKILAIEINQYGVFYKDAELSEVYEPRKSKFSYVAAILYLLYTFALLYLLLAQLLMGKGDIAQLFLLICVGTGFIAMLTGEYRECLAYSKLKFFRLSSLIGYYLVILLLWICAGYFFKAKSMTHKSKAPYESREANRDCVLFGFYDYHDLWHLLSSFALLLTTYRVILLSHPCKMCQFSYIRSMMTGSRDIEIKVDIIAPTPRPSPAPLQRMDTLEDIPENDEVDDARDASDSPRNITDAKLNPVQFKGPCLNGDDIVISVKNECLMNGIATLKSPVGERILLDLPAIDDEIVKPEHLVPVRTSYLASAEDISEVETGLSISDEVSPYSLTYRGKLAPGSYEQDPTKESTEGNAQTSDQGLDATLMEQSSLQVPVSTGSGKRRRRNKERGDALSPPSSRPDFNPSPHQCCGCQTPASPPEMPVAKFYILRP